MHSALRHNSGMHLITSAMIAMFKIAGLRCAEMAALNLEDYDQEQQTLTIRGKRNKTRVILPTGSMFYFSRVFSAGDVGSAFCPVWQRRTDHGGAID